MARRRARQGAPGVGDGLPRRRGVGPGGDCRRSAQDIARGWHRHRRHRRTPDIAEPNLALQQAPDPVAVHRFLHHGLRPAAGHGRKACRARPPGGRLHRRRRAGNGAGRVGDGARHEAAGRHRRVRRRIPGADRNQAAQQRTDQPGRRFRRHRLHRNGQGDGRQRGDGARPRGAGEGR